MKETISIRNFFYTAQFNVGSRKDEVVLLLSQLNGLEFHSSTCEIFNSFDFEHNYFLESLEYDEYGTFSPERQLTLKESEKALKLSLGNSQNVVGYLETDGAEFGGTSSNVSFGVSYLTDTFSHISLGFQHGSAQSNVPSIGDLLVEKGLRNAFSLQGTNIASKGVLMHVPLDHGKYAISQIVQISTLLLDVLMRC